MKREEVIGSITDNKIIVILRGLTRDELMRTAEALYIGGIRLCEVTFSAVGSPSDAEIADDIRALVAAYSDKMHIGAGTVLSPAQVDLAAAAGAEYIISPDTDPDVIGRTRELGLVSVPGALSPSEATAANRAGADFVKLFPAGEFPPSYLKSVVTPLSHIRFLAVGAITENNIADYMRAGAVGAGISSGIVSKKAVAAGDYGYITSQARKYLAAVSAVMDAI